MKNPVLLTIYLVGVYLLTGGCSSDAPRDNPLDPANGIRINGIVQRFYENNPIADAVITLTPGNLIGRSNSDGSYSIENITPGNYVAVCQKPGFLADSMNINLQQQETVNFRLNALPFFTNISITTQHLVSFISSVDTAFVEITVTADDLDASNDVDSIRYQIDAFGFADTLLQINPQEQTFIGQLETRDLGISSLEQLGGQPFIFFVKDLPGAVVASNPQFITRIIRDTPVAQFPINNISITLPFVFEWQMFSAEFPFTYDIEIFQINFNFFTLVDEIRNIPGNVTEFNYSGPLSAGEYFWVLFVIDEFGNKSRSIENPFTIQ